MSGGFLPNTLQCKCNLFQSLHGSNVSKHWNLFYEAVVGYL
jgi:hypothetical protein